MHDYAVSIDRTSEVNLLHDEAFDEQAKSIKPNRRSSENSGVLHNLPQRITLSKEGNVQQSTIENEQQSSSIPNVSWELTSANDEERLFQSNSLLCSELGKFKVDQQVWMNPAGVRPETSEGDSYGKQKEPKLQFSLKPLNISSSNVSFQKILKGTDDGLGDVPSTSEAKRKEILPKRAKALSPLKLNNLRMTGKIQRRFNFSDCRK